MSPIRFSHGTADRSARPAVCSSFAHRPAAKRNFDDDWKAEPATDAPWDPDLLDDDEPQPEPGDFWVEDDEDEV